MAALTVGSLFSGVGGFDLGFERAGFEVRWQVEIDKDAVSVLERHWPAVQRYRDVRDVDPSALAPVDVVTFGSPCQDFSVAGKRAGLEGERSGLFGEAVRIIRGLRPTFAVWENVPGALSSAGGRDFGAVLDAMADGGAMDIAWRVLDARHFGVPQRRRRIFLVCDFRAERAGQVLFESPSSDGDSQTSGTSGQGAPGDAEDGTGSTSESGIAYCLPASARGTGDAHGNAWNTTYVPTIEPVIYQCHGNNVGPIGHLRQGNGGLTGGVPFLSWKRRGGYGYSESDDLAGTLESADTLHGEGLSIIEAVAVSENQRAELRETPYARQLTTGGGKPGEGYSAIRQGMSVRRLTPRECERLMGWPDDHTRYRGDGQEISDGPRYRMIGNGVVAPVAFWIAQRVRTALEAAHASA